MQITETSLNVLLTYARDAGNWSGQPLVGGNVGGGREERGNLTQLKQAGLITTAIEPPTGRGATPTTWIQFTQAGAELVRQHGVEFPDYWIS